MAGLSSGESGQAVTVTVLEEAAAGSQEGEGKEGRVPALRSLGPLPEAAPLTPAYP